MAFVFRSRYEPEVVAQVRAFYETLSEKDRRRYVAVEARHGIYDLARNRGHLNIIHRVYEIGRKVTDSFKATLTILCDDLPETETASRCDHLQRADLLERTTTEHLWIWLREWIGRHTAGDSTALHARRLARDLAAASPRQDLWFSILPIHSLFAGNRFGAVRVNIERSEKRCRSVKL